MPENLVDLGHRIARNAARRLYGQGYTPVQLFYLIPSLCRSPEEMGVIVYQPVEAASSVGAIRTAALRARAESLEKEIA